MKSEIIKIDLEDGNLQKYQLVNEFDWDDLFYKSPNFNKKSIKALAHLYQVNIIPKNSSIYGLLVFFNCNNIKLDLDRNTDIGYIYNDNILLNYYFIKANLNNEVSIIGDTKLEFKDPLLQKYYEALLLDESISYAKGKLDFIDFIPVSNNMGYLSQIKDYKLLVNSHFFLMDRTDIDSPYGELGTPHGLAIQNSKVILPPLNHRECFSVDYNNKVKISNIKLDDFIIKIDDIDFINNQNCKFYFRPESRITPVCDGSALVIVKDKIVAIKDNGEAIVPMAGFIIQTDTKISVNNLIVEYKAKELDLKFAIQVGPAMMIDNNQVTSLTSPFYRGEGTPFPSTVYPLDFDKGRAARIGLGTYNDKPILIWAEGAGKLGHEKSKESCGASLLEFSNFCKSYGIDNLVNLDGGGSAQIIINGKKALKIADRKSDKITEAERPIPFSLVMN